MSATAVYDASHAKRRRRTKAQMESLRDDIYTLTANNQPCTCRQIYYLGIGRFWDKDVGNSRKNYATVVRIIGEMREDDQLPWGWIADNTRWVRRDTMFTSKEDALARWAEAYRRDLWASQDNHVEVWCESDSIAGVLDAVTRPMGAGLFVCRGQSSKTFVYEAAQSYRNIDKPITILYVGDWDPSGLAIPFSVEERMERYSDGEEITFERVAVTVHDVERGRYVTHGVNKADNNYQRFAATCRRNLLDPEVAVEVEAIPPGQLRERVENELEFLVEDPEAWNSTIAAEESERHIFRRILDGDTNAWVTS
jgi:hypothetical protein